MPGFCHSQATSQLHQQTLEYLILLLSGGAIGGAVGGAVGGAIGSAPRTLREVFLLQPHSHRLGNGHRPQVQDTPGTLPREPPQSLGSVHHPQRSPVGANQLVVTHDHTFARSKGYVRPRCVVKGIDGSNRCVESGLAEHQRTVVDLGHANHAGRPVTELVVVLGEMPCQGFVAHRLPPYYSPPSRCPQIAALVQSHTPVSFLVHPACCNRVSASVCNQVFTSSISA